MWGEVRVELWFTVRNPVLVPLAAVLKLGQFHLFHITWITQMYSNHLYKHNLHVVNVE